MRYLFFTALIVLTSLFIGCSNNDESSQLEENFLTINGVRQSLTNQTGVNIYFNGGGLTYNFQTGNTVTWFDMVNIIDQNQVFLPNFNNSEFSNSLHLKFITSSNSSSGNHATVNSTAQVNSNNVIAKYFTNDETQSVYAQANQNIIIEKSQYIITIKFTNVNFGTNTMSGRFKYNY